MTVTAALSAGTAGMTVTIPVTVTAGHGGAGRSWVAREHHGRRRTRPAARARSRRRRTRTRTTRRSRWRSAACRPTVTAGSPNSVEVTIADDDLPPTVTLSAISEPGGGGIERDGDGGAVAGTVGRRDDPGDGDGRARRRLDDHGTLASITVSAWSDERHGHDHDGAGRGQRRRRRSRWRSAACRPR